jgi:hypothetical protein
LEGKRRLLEENLTFFFQNIQPLNDEYHTQQEEFIRVTAPFVFRKSPELSPRQQKDLLDLLDLLLNRIPAIRKTDDKELLLISKNLRKLRQGKELDSTDEIEPSKEDGEDDPAEMRAAMEEAIQRAKETFEDLGIHVDCSDWSPDMSMEELAERIEQIMSDFDDQYTAKEEEEEREKKRERRREKKEADGKENPESKQKDIASLYRQLVRLFHPDLEQDPEKKVKKEDLMKELTVAYEKNDMHTILGMELRWLQKEDGDIAALSDEKLETYAAALHAQVEDVAAEIRDLFSLPRFRPLSKYDSFTQGDAETLREHLLEDITTTKRMLRQMEFDIEELRGPEPFDTLKEIIFAESCTLKKFRQPDNF